MAKSMTGFMGTYSGSVGPVVFYTLRGKQFARRREAARNPRTKAQQAGRKVFGTVAHLAARMRGVLAIGLRAEADSRGMGASSLFVSLNRGCVTLEAGMARVDYARLQLSAGPLAPSVYGVPRRVSAQRIEVAVGPDAERPADWRGNVVYLYAFAPATEESWCSAPLPLSAGLAAIELPPALAGVEVHLYAFTADYRPAASPTAYLGTSAPSELEVDEGLQVGSDELEEHEDCADDGQHHQPQGYAGEPQAVAALEALGQPVDNHAEDEEQEGGPVVAHDVGHLGQVPVRANLVHHLAGGAPGHLVGLGGVEVGAAAEEEAGEGDEDKGEAGVPDG